MEGGPILLDKCLFNPCEECFWTRGVVSGGAGGAMAPQDLGRSFNPISTRGDRVCSSNNNGTPGFSDLPMALHSIAYFYSHFQGKYGTKSFLAKNN